MGDEWGEVVELGFEGLDRFADKYHDKAYDVVAKIPKPRVPWKVQRQQNLQLQQQQRGRAGQQQQLKRAQPEQQQNQRDDDRQEQDSLRGGYGKDDARDAYDRDRDRYGLTERRMGDGRGSSDGGVIYIRKRTFKDDPQPPPRPLYDDPDPRFAGMGREELKYRGGNAGAAQQPQGQPQYFQAQRAVSQFYETRTVPMPASPGQPVPPQYALPQAGPLQPYPHPPYPVPGHSNPYAYSQPNVAAITYPYIPDADPDDKKKGKRPRPKKRASSYSPPPKPHLDSSRRARSKSPKRDHTTAAVLGGLAGALLGGAARGGSAKGALGGAVVGGLVARQADVWHERRGEKKLEEAERRREKREQRRLEDTYG